MAYSWSSEGGEGADVYVKAVGSDGAMQLTEGEAADLSPAWSPDGSEIAFLRYRPGSCSIVLVQVLGGAEGDVGPCDRNTWGEIAWSPDGRWLAFPERGDPKAPSAIHLLSLESGERRQLTHPPELLAGDHDPAFSPDGAWLSFVRSDSSRQGDLYVISVAGGEEQRRTFDDRWIWGHTWAPDEPELLFASSRLGFFNLWRVGARRGAPQWVPVTGGESLVEPSVSPASGRLVYEQWSYDANLWRRTLDAGGSAAEAQPIFPSSQWDSHPRFSPRGDRIAFTSRRSGKLEIWVGRADGTEPVQWTESGDSFASTLQWSPSGSRIVFSARRDGDVDLYLAEVEGLRVERFTRGPEVELNPAWSRDGERILYASDRGGSWQIWQVPVAGGEPEQITRGGGIFAQESMDGSRIFFSRNEADGIWWRPAAGGDEAPATDALSSLDWGNWAVAPGGLFLVRRSPAGAELVFWDAEDGSLRSHLAFERLPFNPSLSLSPDGREVLFSRIDRNESDLMWVELPGAAR